MRGGSALLLVAVGITVLYLAAKGKTACLGTFWACVTGAKAQ